MPPKRAAVEEAQDFDALKVTELKDECTKRGLETTGRKADLVKRLKDHEDKQGNTSAAPAADTAPATTTAEEPAPATKGRARRGAAKAEEAKAEAEEETAVPTPVAAPTRGRGRGAAKAAKAEEEDTKADEPKKEEEAPAPKGRGRGKAAKAAKAEPEAKEEDVNTVASKQFAALASQKSSKLRPNAKVDSHVPGAQGYKVYSDSKETFDVMLNQTNIGQNNNKYYVIQLLTRGGSYATWNRWGRVGEPGQSKLSHHDDLDDALKDFKGKFKDKTSNHWDARDKFKQAANKYTPVEIVDDEPAKTSTVVTQAGGPPKKIRPSKLQKATHDFVKLIFDTDMFKAAMSTFDIDVKKMPLGQISKAQIAKGYQVLEEIEQIISGNHKGNLTQLSSEFYTIIPHSFGRSVPPVINGREMLDKKKEMLMVLGDIEIAQKLLENKDETAAEEVDHPVDQNYHSLHCGLRELDTSDNEFKVLNQYLNATMGMKLELKQIWGVDREGESARFSAHDAITNRKLLWHGTNVAVVAAILKSGLRIMPHSGGRVGRGIYLASENAKSACYVGTTQEGKERIGIMFLVEAALGKEHHITRDDSSLRSAPKGYDSIIAKGSGEPDPKLDTTLKIDGKDVTVPQGKRIDMPQYHGSSFDKSEYLLYQESQHRIRYVLKLKFPSSGWF